jgi:hypothetical protein
MPDPVDIPIEYIKVPDWNQRPPRLAPPPTDDERRRPPEPIPPLVVSMHSDEEYFLIDGLTRLEAMWFRRETTARCVVLVGLTPQQEAQKFLELNSRVR